MRGVSVGVLIVSGLVLLALAVDGHEPEMEIGIDEIVGDGDCCPAVVVPIRTGFAEIELMPVLDNRDAVVISAPAVARFRLSGAGGELDPH
jgi:hypothetical protein